MTPRVLVHHGVASRLDAAAASCAGQPEEGGILLGAYRTGGMEVTALTEAAPTDERRLHSFTRQDAMHQGIASRAWHASGGTVTLAGEWHTHPHGEPRPSPTDLATWKELLHREQRPLVFVIAAPGAWWLYLAARRFFVVRLGRLHVIERGRMGIVMVPEAATGVGTPPMVRRI